ncbi:MAG: hypothetical protein UW39_C0017G0007 [Parcubacteria group bacterium GW2011_GWC2_44_17]|uniref:Uncharacterized protein n=1 Tax=Candidatus Jacksonbacteria bacterium RIFCSPLOWO2_02_FULL_44_20 TaxID=1798460 RepID=A0A1G2ABN8_9BACT|nr:MAG: hypothetical protein UW39_C0017G0007 [Parcubacteria group bacterium GW2011_GWC2_44_17]KKT50251.1 MAG: hypothetical protein UW40_C0007G0026 [Parcubacteria group bacterium GW2011_GWF2_44_17]OGY70064.1 MAG: hypothetical protein A3C00_00230 [Candidatus Jacksonbacteria bacterium RIFCSPHIGHO2_02_FULL_44_25]OGY73467.1 MAG: hypothetical protein A3H61_04945 [Candidatus Jacksonbacteria bacterium RIFCSPLOWO2_02_FULL_44_20]HCE87053.1 hypothetical protein [Candidatus Jacksonbacteria bacterium]
MRTFIEPMKNKNAVIGIVIIIIIIALLVAVRKQKYAIAPIDEQPATTAPTTPPPSITPDTTTSINDESALRELDIELNAEDDTVLPDELNIETEL